MCLWDDFWSGFVNLSVYAGRRAQIQCSPNSPCCFYSVLSCHVHQRHGGMQTGWDHHAGHGSQVIQTSEGLLRTLYMLFFVFCECTFTSFHLCLPRNSALEALINFAYNGHIAIDQQNVQVLLIGASFLQLQNVKDACCSFLQQR